MEALKAGADIVMLDNAGPALSKQWAAEVKEAFPGAIVEASGGVNEVSVLEFATAGSEIDIISMGSLTQDMQHIDYSLVIDIE